MEKTMINKAKDIISKLAAKIKDIKDFFFANDWELQSSEIVMAGGSNYLEREVWKNIKTGEIQTTLTKGGAV